jgi:hypothetical protein
MSYPPCPCVWVGWSHSLYCAGLRVFAWTMNYWLCVRSCCSQEPGHVCVLALHPPMWWCVGTTCRETWACERRRCAVIFHLRDKTQPLHRTVCMRTDTGAHTCTERDVSLQVERRRRSTRDDALPRGMKMKRLPGGVTYVGLRCAHHVSSWRLERWSTERENVASVNQFTLLRRGWIELEFTTLQHFKSHFEPPREVGMIQCDTGVYHLDISLVLWQGMWWWHPHIRFALLWRSWIRLDS